MTDSYYKINISGEGVSIERDVPKDIGDQVILLMLTGQASPSIHRPPARDHGAASNGVQPSPHSHIEGKKHGDQSPPPSIRETLDASGAKRAPDKITAIGSFVKETESKDFNRDDIVRMFESAAEKVPSNLARDIKWTLKAGWIAERAGSKGTYYVTNTGQQAMSAQFSREFVKRTQGMVGGKKATTGKDSKD